MCHATFPLTEIIINPKNPYEMIGDMEVRNAVGVNGKSEFPLTTTEKSKQLCGTGAAIKLLDNLDQECNVPVHALDDIYEDRTFENILRDLHATATEAQLKLYFMLRYQNVCLNRY
ncbi:hypothetical protein GJ496_007049 [Pomphorhynchus laevis]|nr:hypothetical protein GJ496_007049 [Pomphorhynchus laevis]